MIVELVVHSYHPGIAGAEVATYLAARALADKGIRVQVRAVNGPTAAPAVLGDDVAYGRTVDGPLDGAATTPALIHLIDSVYDQTVRRTVDRAEWLGVPLVFTPMTAAALWCDHDLIATVIRRAAAVAVYTAAEADLVTDLGAVRVVRVAHGPALADEADGPGFRRRHGVPADAPMVLFLSRKVRSKGYVQLLEALPEVWFDHPDAYAVFIGPRVDDDCSEVFARHTDDRVIELGQVDDQAKTDALDASSVVCLPTTADVFPLVVVEVWAMRRPLICGHFADSAAVVHETDGLLCETDPGAIAAAVHRCLEDPVLTNHLTTSGRTRFEMNHSWATLAARMTDVYRSVISPDAGSIPVATSAPVADGATAGRGVT